MSAARDLIVDRIPRVEGTREHLASWYTEGLSDGLGDRLLMFDNTSAPSWELLRFRPDFAAALGFESALRERVDRLRRFQHPSFTTVRSVEELGAGDGLALVTTYAPGRRLSEAFARPHPADSVIRLISQLTPALGALQEQGDDIAHGALTGDRVMVTTEGRLMIREHVLGSAIAGLGLSARRLWADLGIVTAPSVERVPALDRRADVIQLGLIALSLLVGRRIAPEEYPNGIQALLDQLAETRASRPSPPWSRLRHWIERALQVKGHAFACARDADQGLSDLPVDPHNDDEYLGLLDLREPGHNLSARQPAARPTPSRPRLAAAAEPGAGEAAEENSLDQFMPETAAAFPAAHLSERLAAVRGESAPAHFEGGRFHWLTAAVALVAIGEALLIGRLLFVRSGPSPSPPASIVVDFARPGAEVLVDGRLAGVTPLELKVDARTRSIRVLSHETATQTSAPIALAVDAPRGPRASSDAAGLDVLRTAARTQRSGGVRVSSPFELHVLENERLLGSSAEGIVVTTAGRHAFDLVNSALGYRVRRAVDVKPGQIVALAVTPANGSVSINALPWAEVSIDGKAVGQTPLGNVSVSLGEHEIVFRHPQLGERREKVLVRSDRLTRVSANLRQ